MEQHRRKRGMLGAATAPTQYGGNCSGLSCVFSTFYTRAFTRLLFLTVSVCEHVSVMERLKG